MSGDRDRGGTGNGSKPGRGGRLGAEAGVSAPSPGAARPNPEQPGPHDEGVPSPGAEGGRPGAEAGREDPARRGARRVLLAAGTRPEVIKLAPVYRALQRMPGVAPLLLLTGQHREQLQQALALFDLPVAANLDVMTERQALPALAARLLPRVADVLHELGAEMVVVHGDTLTTFTVAWAAFLSQIPVVHVEAGLRSRRLSEPFPEEANRRLTDAISDLLLPPTPAARENLLSEGVAPERIVVTGQTGIDAILYASRAGRAPEAATETPYVVITLHRRENWPRLSALTQALARVAARHPELRFIYPVHLNPAVREGIAPAFAAAPNVRLLEPLEYGAMAALLRESLLIVTDSGGLQEEGAALGVPVVVVRDVTERPEGVATGALRMAGTDPARLEAALEALIGDAAARERMRAAANPFGDGRGGERAAQAIAWRLGLAQRPADWVPSGE